jgi:hypothetical protein
MWTRKFWKATAERCVRGGAAALGGALVAGDWVLDVMNVSSLSDGATVFVGGALTSLLLSLAGGAFGSGDGPSFTGQEELKPTP